MNEAGNRILMRDKMRANIHIREYLGPVYTVLL